MRRRTSAPLLGSEQARSPRRDADSLAGPREAGPTKPRAPNVGIYLDRRARPGGVRLALLVPSWPARTIVLLVRLTASRST